VIGDQPPSGKEVINIFFGGGRKTASKLTRDPIIKYLRYKEVVKLHTYSWCRNLQVNWVGHKNYWKKIGNNDFYPVETNL